MANPQFHDPIREKAKNNVEYNAFQFIDGHGNAQITIESAIRLMQLHQMHVSQKNITAMAKELKEGHNRVQWLHQLQQLIQKLTNTESGDARGTLKLTHSDKNFNTIAELEKLIETMTVPVPGPIDAPSTLDLTGENAKPMLDLLNKLTYPNWATWSHLSSWSEKEAVLNILKSNKILEADGIAELKTAIRSLTTAKEWDQANDILELKKKLKEAEGEPYKIKFDWPANDEFSREQREALMTASDTTCKDFALQNDMKMQDLNRAYQENLEILQMARQIIKALNDDKVHKGRSASGR